MSINVTDAELEILKVLWCQGITTAREIRESIYPEGTSSDRATVQKLLERLESKSLVERNRGQFVHTFRPLLTRDELVGQQIEALADRLTDGSFAPLISQMMGRSMSATDRAELRKLLNQKKG